jgi:predicted RNA-binding Zn-ribbon protein involved in translation (DUF1610 family)
MKLMAKQNKIDRSCTMKDLDLTSPEELRVYRCPLCGEPAFKGEESKDLASHVTTNLYRWHGQMVCRDCFMVL